MHGIDGYYEDGNGSAAAAAAALTPVG
jgi:hypothetical protein